MNANRDNPPEDVCVEGRPHLSASADQVIIPAAGQAHPTWEALVSTIQGELRGGRLALLIGSAVSGLAPSGVAVANQASREIVGRLVAGIDLVQRTRVNQGLREAPFEVLVGRLKELWPDRAYETVEALCEIDKPNVVHQQIADLLFQAVRLGVRLPVVTTNYDRGIELAIDELEWPDGSRPQPIVWPRDLASESSAGGVFHIHGMLGDRDSYVLDFRDEFALKRWKIRHLNRLLSDRTLLVLGFSGEDLDVTEAVLFAQPKALIWFRRSEEQCDSRGWSLAAQMLVGDVRSRSTAVAVSTSDRIETALGPFTPRVEPNARDGSVLAAKRYRRIFPSDTPPWIRLWARWAALRSGLAGIGENLTSQERELLTDAQRAEFDGFSHYYAARHKDGAASQVQAAVLAQAHGASGRDIVYHRNLAAEFLNRGAYTTDALRVIFTTLAQTELGLLTGRLKSSQALLGEVLNLSSSVATAWPMYPLTLTNGRLRAASRWLGRLTSSQRGRRAFDKDMIMRIATSLPGSLDYLRARERYMWLGLRPRLTNLTRRAAFSCVWNNQASLTEEVIRSAERHAACSVRWALIALDPVRLAKCMLLLAEIVDIRQSAGFAADPMTPRVLADADLLGWRATTQHAWDAIRLAQISPPARGLARCVYQLGVRLGPRRGLRTRLVGLALLETS